MRHGFVLFRRFLPRVPVLAPLGSDRRPAFCIIILEMRQRLDRVYLIKRVCIFSLELLLLKLGLELFLFFKMDIHAFV